ncbi:MAG TPA: hypothetical protein VJZ27_09450 [Aggregatilineales bacterium]|nr:hypothetical protein [Aggregatilineales bacterium]
MVYPDSQRIYVYRRGQPDPEVYTIEDTINGGDILPDFSIAVRTFCAS